MRDLGFEEGWRPAVPVLSITLLAFALLASSGWVAGNEAPAVTLAAPGFGPIATGDFTGDGATDLVGVLQGDRVAIWPAPLADTVPIFIDVPSPLGLAVGDLDEDGLSDLAVLTDAGVSLFLQADGWEQPGNQIPESSSGILLADLQGDGLADLVTWDLDSVDIRLNEGGGNFAPPRVIHRGGDSVAAADIDQDGLLELLVSNAQDILVHYRAASPDVPSSLIVQLEGDFESSLIRAADIDRDGLPEVALLRTGGGGGELTVYCGGPQQLYGDPDLRVEGSFAPEFLLADMDGDGFGDVVAALKDGGELILNIAPAPSGLAVVGTREIPARGAGTMRHLAAAELVGDGLVDLAVRAKGNVYVYTAEDEPAELVREIPSPVVLEDGESVSLSLDRYFADDLSTLTYRVVGDVPAGLRVGVDGQFLRITAPDGWAGRAAVAVEAWDGVEGHAWVRSNDFVIFVNGAPRIASVPPTRTHEGSDYTYHVTAYDDFPQDDVVTYVLLRGPSGMTIDREDGRLVWRPEQTGEHDIVLAARDTHGGEDRQSFTLLVDPNPATPVVGPWDAFTVGSVALVGALGAWAVANENARFSLGLLAAPLYTKLKREQVLQHFVRGQIYGYILANPGEHYNAIRGALGLTNGCVAHHLRTLEREGFVKSKKFGLYRRFYPKNMRVPEDGEFVNEVRRTIIDIIRRRPGISQVELAHTLNVTPPTVNYHLGILTKAKKVKVIRKGRRTHCFAV